MEVGLGSSCGCGAKVGLSRRSRLVRLRGIMAFGPDFRAFADAHQEVFRLEDELAMAAFQLIEVWQRRPYWRPQESERVRALDAELGQAKRVREKALELLSHSAP